MKVSNKAHRVLTIVAAVFLLLEMIFAMVGMVRTLVCNLQNGATASIVGQIFPMMGSLLIKVFCVIALFRGKKDVAAGALFVLAALVRVAMTLISVVSVICMIVADMPGYITVNNLFNLLGGIAVVGLYAFLAFECFKPGKLSGSGMKVLLILLPIFAAILSVIASMVLQIPTLEYGRMDLFAINALSMLLGMGISYIPMLLMGIAFAIPVYEKNTYGAVNYAQNMYTNI